MLGNDASILANHDAIGIGLNLVAIDVDRFIERSLKVDQRSGDVCDAWALFLQSLDRKRKRRMKSPFTTESTDEHYCRSPRGVMPSRPAQLALFKSEDCRSTIPRSYVNYSYRILETFVPRCDQ